MSFFLQEDVGNGREASAAGEEERDREPECAVPPEDSQAQREVRTSMHVNRMCIRKCVACIDVCMYVCVCVYVCMYVCMYGCLYAVFWFFRGGRGGKEGHSSPLRMASHLLGIVPPPLPLYYVICPPHRYVPSFCPPPLPLRNFF